MNIFKSLNNNQNYNKVLNFYQKSLNSQLGLENKINLDSYAYFHKDFILIKTDLINKITFETPIVKSINNLTQAFEFIKLYSASINKPIIMINVNRSLLDEYLKNHLLNDFLVINQNDYYSLTLSENLQLKRLYQLSFNDSSKYIDYYFNEKVKNLSLKKICIDNLIVSSLYLKTQKISYHHHEINSQMLLGACTHPLYTRKGLMASLIKKTLNDSFQNNISLITLNPFDKNFYEQFNFISYSFYDIKEANSFKGYNFKKANFSDIHILLDIYNKFSSQFNIYTLRNERYYFDLLKELYADNDQLIIYSKDGVDIGYYIKIDNIIEEHCSVDNILITKNQEFVQTPANWQNTPLNMARIINPLYFLTIYPFNKSQFKGKIKIIDNIILENNIIIDIDLPGKIEISHSDQYDLSITIDTLSTLVLNGNVDNNPHPFFQLFTNSNNLSFEKY